MNFADYIALRNNAQLKDIAKTNANVEVSNAHTGADGTIYTDLPTRLDSIDGKVKDNTSQLNDIVSYQNNANNKSNQNLNPIYIAYGDSNTRYYIGDSDKAGSITYAFSTVVEYLSKNNVCTYNLKVKNEGYPGQVSTWAKDNFNTIILNNAVGKPSFVTIGYGTNDIRQTVTLDDYIANIEYMVTTAITNNIVPIVIGIPWFESPDGGSLEAQNKLPAWNEALYKMCQKYGVTFIDTYKMFKDNPNYFNETLAKRHYSTRATRIIGQRVYETILDKIDNGEKIKPFICDFINYPYEKSNLVSCSGANAECVYKEIPNFVCKNVMKIPTGATLTIKAKGSTLLSFLPIEAATLTITHINASSGEAVTITATQDDGQYYPIKKYAIMAYGMVDYDVTITVNTGNLYIQESSCELQPNSIYTYGATVLGTVLNTKRFIGREYFIDTVGNGIHMADNVYGLNFRMTDNAFSIASSTSYKTAVEPNVWKGFRFYDITANKKYLHNGTTFTEYQ